MMRRVATLAAVAVTVAAQASTLTTSASASITSSASLAGATNAANSSSSSGPYTHTVAVAKGGHKFTPDVIVAAVGDIIGMLGTDLLALLES